MFTFLQNNVANYEDPSDAYQLINFSVMEPFQEKTKLLFNREALIKYKIH